MKKTSKLIYILSLFLIKFLARVGQDYPILPLHPDPIPPLSLLVKEFCLVLYARLNLLKALGIEQR